MSVDKCRKIDQYNFLQACRFYEIKVAQISQKNCKFSKVRSLHSNYLIFHAYIESVSSIKTKYSKMQNTRYSNRFV